MASSLFTRLVVEVLDKHAERSLQTSGFSRFVTRVTFSVDLIVTVTVVFAVVIFSHVGRGLSGGSFLLIIAGSCGARILLKPFPRPADLVAVVDQFVQIDLSVSWAAKDSTHSRRVVVQLQARGVALLEPLAKSGVLDLEEGVDLEELFEQVAIGGAVVCDEHAPCAIDLGRRGTDVLHPAAPKRNLVDLLDARLESLSTGVLGDGVGCLVGRGREDLVVATRFFDARLLAGAVLSYLSVFQSVLGDGLVVAVDCRRGDARLDVN